MKLLLVLVLLLVISTLHIYVVEGKTLWGARKKKDQQDEKSKPTKPKIDDILQQRKSRKQGKTPRMTDLKQDEINVQMKEMLGSYLTQLEELIDSDDFSSLVDPNVIRPLLEQVGAINPQLQSLFGEINWDDIDLQEYRDSLKEGVRMIQDNADQIFQILNDPNALEQYTSMLPQDVKDILSSLQNGDLDSLTDIFSNIPGMDSSLEMIKKLMGSEPSDINETLKSVLSNSEYIEEARQQFLNSPEMAEALGIPQEVLQDPKQWAQLMAENMNAFGEMNGNTEMQPRKPKKRFSRTA